VKDVKDILKDKKTKAKAKEKQLMLATCFDIN